MVLLCVHVCIDRRMDDVARSENDHTWTYIQNGAGRGARLCGAMKSSHALDGLVHPLSFVLDNTFSAATIIEVPYLRTSSTEVNRSFIPFLARRFRLLLVPQFALVVACDDATRVV